jgi:gliding motility-associated-like protein
MATGGVSYLWTPSAVLNNPFTQSPLATINRDTRFTVLVTDIVGCKDTASVLLRVYQGIRYFVPNAFSPNGDGLNEIFRPIAVGVVSTEWFRVYNRYGQVMYESSNIQNGWDGTYKGQRQPIGNYIWSIKGKGRDGKVIEMKGNVVLVR